MHIREFVQHPPDHPFYAVIGHPLSQSKSALLHNYALKELHLPGKYYALDTPVDSFAWVGQLLSLSSFRGLNVTIPHKSHVMDLLHITDPLAQAVGAVNTINPEHIGFAGYNTDIAGVELSLKKHALLFAGQPVIILGTGGAARATVAALKEFKIPKVYVVSRKPQTLKWPNRINGVHIHVLSYDDLEAVLNEAALIVNTTPVGMIPHTDDSPFPKALIPGLKMKVCFDAIYNPLQTQFLKQAKDSGAAATINGITMFVGQAAAAFTIWTGKSFPVAGAEKLLLEALKTNA